MVTTIQINEKTKSMLDKLKIHYRQSYNELIEKMAEESLNKKDIMTLAGSWSQVDEKDIESMKESILKLRKSSTKELLKH